MSVCTKYVLGGQKNLQEKTPQKLQNGENLLGLLLLGLNLLGCFPPQPVNNHKILPSMRDEALFQSSVSRETPRSLLKRERVFDTLDATQEGPQDTHPHSRGTPSFMSQLKKSPVFPLHNLR